jgi:hypothetical protein
MLMIIHRFGIISNRIGTDYKRRDTDTVSVHIGWYDVIIKSSPVIPCKKYCTIIPVWTLHCSIYDRSHICLAIRNITLRMFTVSVVWCNPRDLGKISFFRSYEIIIKRLDIWRNQANPLLFKGGIQP